MWIDLSCPVETEGWERVGDAARGQIYVHLYNLAEQEIRRVVLRLTLRDAEGSEVLRTSVGQDCQAGARRRFILHAPADGLPAFEQLDLLPESVLLEDGTEWTVEEGALVDARFEPLPAGPARVALVALAGKDAACFPETLEHAWRCVCGRLNPLEADTCVRCLRAKASVMEEFRPDTVEERYQALYEKRVAREQEMRHQEVLAQKRLKARRLAKMRNEQMLRKRRTFAVCLVLAGLALLSILLWK